MNSNAISQFKTVNHADMKLMLNHYGQDNSLVNAIFFLHTAVFKKDLDKDVAGDTSRNFAKLLLALVQVTFTVSCLKGEIRTKTQSPLNQTFIIPHLTFCS